jgi:hypothetical protein
MIMDPTLALSPFQSKINQRHDRNGKDRRTNEVGKTKFMRRGIPSLLILHEQSVFGDMFWTTTTKISM